MSTTPVADATLPFDNSFARLAGAFYARVDPTPVEGPGLLRVNNALALELGLDPRFLESREGLEVLSGNRVPLGAEPLAMVYAGHQFGQWVPRLGDGRAVLLGELRGRDGHRRDVQLKGAGPTPFSRRGDGRAALGPVLREYIVSEAMAGLGIPTTRALAMVTTGEPVFRERAEPGAILTRVSACHVRVGTFEYFHRRGESDSVRALADYVIGRLYPASADAENPYRALLDTVIGRQAELVAKWMGVGFIHGVMNTDNASIAGETIDYGPCAFLDHYHPERVFSSIDHGGRYAYNQQPRIALWNLTRFAESLLPLLHSEEEEALASARDALDAYAACFEARYQEILMGKIGLVEAGDGGIALASNLLEMMSAHKVDYTLTFRRLCQVDTGEAESERALRRSFPDVAAFDAWCAAWRERLRAEGRDDATRRSQMRADNPAFIPRNHRIQQVIDAATRDGDLQPLDELLRVVSDPYRDHPELAAYADPPEPHEVVHQTFCGT